MFARSFIVPKLSRDFRALPGLTVFVGDYHCLAGDRLVFVTPILSKGF